MSNGLPRWRASSSAAVASAAEAAAAVLSRHVASCSVRMNRLVLLSSTTSTRRPASAPSGAATGEGGVSDALPNEAVNQNVLPTRPAVHAHLPAERGHDAAADGEAQTGAAVLAGGRAVGLGERVEQAVLRLGSMPTPVSNTSTRSTGPVGRGSARAARMTTSPADVNFTALDARLAMTWPNRTGSPRRPRAGSGSKETTSSSPSPCLLGDDAGALLDDAAGIEVDRLEVKVAGLDLGEVEDVVHEAEEGAAGLVDAFGEPPLVLRQLGPREQLGQADHAVERSPDLVAHRREELDFMVEAASAAADALIASSRARAVAREACSRSATRERIAASWLMSETSVSVGTASAPVSSTTTQTT